MLMIKKVTCDEAMARKKGLHGFCDKDCAVCFCGIEIDQDGGRRHVDVEKNRSERVGGSFYGNAGN